MMKRSILLFLLVVGAAGAAVWPTRYYWEMASCPSGAGPNCIATPQPCDGGTCAGTAPTTSATQGLSLGGVSADGIPLPGVQALQVTICAGANPDGGATCTVSGAGSMVAYDYRYSNAQWARAPTDDANVPSGCAGNHCCKVTEMSTGVRSDREYWVASGVTVSCGNGLDVMVDGQHQEAR